MHFLLFSHYVGPDHSAAPWTIAHQAPLSVESSHVFLNKKKILITSKTLSNQETHVETAFSERNLKILNPLDQTDAVFDNSLLLNISLPIPPKDQTLGVTEK